MKREKTTLAAVALLAVSLAAPAGAQAKTDKPATATVPMPKTDRMPMIEFKRLLAAGEVVVIDVRPGGAYVGGHIPGALSMPEDTIDAAVAEKLRRMGKPIATYCS